MSLTPGKQVGKYQVRSLIAAGGMGEVYLGEDETLGRRIAIKVLPDRSVTDATAQHRMLREARAAAALDHPNICSIYEVGEGDGFKFIAMQFVEGEPLDEKIKHDALDLRQILNIAVQISDALAEAHAKGIIHRDIKPANIMVTPRGDVKVMDFGLAKFEPTESVASEAKTATLLSSPDAIIGTAPYMSPEQIRGKKLDTRSDLFSLGVVLYEMISGSRPFKGATTAEVAAAIISTNPPPLTRFVSDLPVELQRIVDKLLHKDPDDRYQTARDVLTDLRTLRNELEFRDRLEHSASPDTADARPSGEVVGEPTAAMPRVRTEEKQRTVTEPRSAAAAGNKLPKIGVAAAIVMAAFLVAGFWYWNKSNAEWARSQVPRIAELSEAGDYFGAYDLATQVERYLPGDPTLTPLLATISDSLSVTTEPAGANVFLRRFDPDRGSEKQMVGVTPISSHRIARGQYIVYIEKDGFAPAERSISGAVIRGGGMRITPPPLQLDQKLMPVDSIPAGMVYVPGGEYRLVSWERPTESKARLDDFAIDKYEVSNRDFKEFINAGGYLKKQYWKHPFVKDANTLTWEAGIGELKDRTGLPGPRTWSNQQYPDGKADHPVTDVTWYEAAAYAAYRGKELPTIYQWEKAARNGHAHALGNYMPWGLFYPGETLNHRANFDAAGTTPVSALEFGMSPFGAYNMAGNVSEWTLNDSSEGYMATGGSWGDPSYTFAQYGRFPGFFSSEKRGFRCALNLPGATGHQGGYRIEIKNEVPVYAASSQADFHRWAEAYRYEKTPLNAEVIEMVETDSWRREKITYDGAGGERAIAYLYLPKNFPPPFQAVHFIPAADVDRGFRPLSVSTENRMAPLLRAGRAVFAVVVKGYIERLHPPDFQQPEKTTAEFKELLVDRITDIRRGLDYLSTRNDVDATKMALYAPSAGARLALIAGALEDRYRCIFLVGAGIVPSDSVTIAEANTVNFAPHIRGPKLMLQGKFDEDTPLKTQSEPLYRLLSNPKQLVLFDGGHVPPNELALPIALKFMDEKMGPVRSE